MKQPQKETLIAAHAKADKKGKTLLEQLYGPEIFQPDIRSRVTSFEHACSVLGLAVGEVLAGTDTPDEAAYKKIKTIAKALNEGWVPNWNDDDEYKWFPYFNMDSFSFYCVNYIYSFSYVSSRLCFRTRELAEYAGTQFENIYKDYLTIQP